MTSQLTRRIDRAQIERDLRSIWARMIDNGYTLEVNIYDLSTLRQYHIYIYIHTLWYLYLWSASMSWNIRVHRAGKMTSWSKPLQVLFVNGMFLWCQTCNEIRLLVRRVTRWRNSKNLHWKRPKLIIRHVDGNKAWDVTFCDYARRNSFNVCSRKILIKRLFQVWGGAIKLNGAGTTSAVHAGTCDPQFWQLE